MSSQEESEIMSETELYADWEGTYVAQDWVPDPMRIPGNPQWEICLHTVQLAQRKHVYEDPIGRTRSEAGMRIYRFSQSLHTATGPILLYRPHARDGEGPLEMAHWPAPPLQKSSTARDDGSGKNPRKYQRNAHAHRLAFDRRASYDNHGCQTPDDHVGEVEAAG